MDPRIANIDLKSAGRSLADLAMPRTCVACGRRLILQERHICTECLADLPLTHFETLPRNPMSERLNAIIERGQEGYIPYASACALFFYNSESSYRHIAPALKYGRRFSDGRYFAAMLGRALASSPLYADVDLVVPVPLHWTRRWQRGYNQAEVIAREVVRELAAGAQGAGSAAAVGAAGAVLGAGVLRRVRRTHTQTRLSVAGKSRNVAGAFRIGRIPTVRNSSARHSGASGNAPFRHILLIDDVCTTGATLAACHKALRGTFGPEVRISAATLAFVTAA